MDQDRYHTFEQMLADCIEEKKNVDQQLEILSEQGKTRTAHYKELLIRKTMLIQHLSLFRKYKLL